MAPGIAGQQIEQRRGIRSILVAAGEHSQVGVDLRGRGVVVAGAQVDIPAELGSLLPDHQRHLAMGFQVEKPVHDMHAGPFHLPCPVDVVVLVEAGLQLHDGGDILALVRRVDQGFDDRAFASRAVQRLLDGEDIGIGGRLVDEVDDALECFVRMMHQDVAAADLAENIPAFR